MFAGRAVTDGGLHTDQRGFAGFLFGFFNRPVDGGHIVAVLNFLHLPAVGLEAHFDIFGKRQSCGAGQGYFVVVIKNDEFPQTQMTGQSAGFRDHAFHHVAVSGHDIRVMINDGLPVAIEPRRQMRLGNSHADGVGQSLPQRAGSHFHACRMLIFRMSRCAAAPLAEIFDVVERKIVAGQMQESV
ncbi:MAG: hypothetical protein MZV70_38610 [Desulfobacterales bacterium]|nr:hypothetical protein [Desulfobacterales bacterium]